MVITYWQFFCLNFSDYSDYLSLSAFASLTNVHSNQQVMSKVASWGFWKSSLQSCCLITSFLFRCMCCIVPTQQLCSFCLLGPKVMRWKCLTPITAITGAASQWSRPHPQTPVEMPTQSPELLSNPSLSPLILLDRVSSEHHNTHKQTYTAVDSHYSSVTIDENSWWDLLHGCHLAAA